MTDKTGKEKKTHLKKRQSNRQTATMKWFIQHQIEIYRLPVLIEWHLLDAECLINS